MEKWQDQNRFYLNWRIQKVRDALNIFADSEYKAESPETFCNKPDKDFPIDKVSKVFGLTDFEQDILIMCAAMEIEGDFPVLCGKIQGDPAKTYPTFAIALSCLHKSHWSAVLAESPLRRWNLISVKSSGILSHSPIFIDESILHFILGISQKNSQKNSQPDNRLAQISEPVIAESDTTDFNQNTAKKIADTVKKWSENSKKAYPIHLFGNDFEDIRDTAAKACFMLDLKLYAMPISFIPDDPGKLELIIKLWSRESLLNNSALIIECRDDLVSIESKTRAALCLMLQKIKCTVFIATFDSKPADLCLCVSFEVKNRLWGASPKNSGAKIAELAQHIETKATWADLILPESQIELLRAVASHVRYRAKVYDTWGFASKYSRGMGITAIFAGLSGTGKTMAAEVLANELDLKLYKIELSSVVSKYIGETEKHLRKVFDSAQKGGAILLFDEADALFGKRSEVKDSRDRHANMEISYLLQKMEEYTGAAILTTNMKEAFDDAFLRRIRFAVYFPFPKVKQRESIWKGIFPTSTPLNELDYKKLSQLNVSGGSIKNIAMNAAFAAAGDNCAVSMEHLLKAAKIEYAKMEKTLTQGEISGW